MISYLAVGIRLTASGGWAGLGEPEHRALPAAYVQPALLPYSAAPPLNVTTANALRVSDAYACVPVLADSVSSLPLHVYRRTPAGRVPAGDNTRAVQLLSRPSPGSTGVDLISTVMVHLNVYGDAFIGKYRADGEVVQLGLIPPDSVQVELRGQRIVYTLDTVHGRTSTGPRTSCTSRGCRSMGCAACRPVTQCRIALGLSSSLQESARQYFDHGSSPSGVLTVPNGSQEAAERSATFGSTGTPAWRTCTGRGRDRRHQVHAGRLLRRRLRSSSSSAS